MSHFLFSKNLREQLIRYFKARGFSISHTQAEEYLHKMADLCELFSDSERSFEAEGGGARHQAGGDAAFSA